MICRYRSWATHPCRPRWTVSADACPDCWPRADPARSWLVHAAVRSTADVARRIGEEVAPALSVREVGVTFVRHGVAPGTAESEWARRVHRCLGRDPEH